MAEGNGSRHWLSKHKALTLSAAVALVSVAGVIWIGFHYWHEPDYWLVAIPGFGTAIGTIGLAGATFRLIQREGQDRENTLTALTHSQTMATEAARQRRDARARLLWISHWGPVEVHLDPRPSEDSRQRDEATYNMPGDANKTLYITQRFNLVAADEARMTITLNGLTAFGKRHIGMESVRLPFRGTSGDSIVQFTVGRTVAEWVAIAEQREHGEPGDEDYAWVSVDDGFDDGVRDSYQLVQGGCPFRRSTHLDGQWILDTDYQNNSIKSIGFAIQPMVRMYFVSKIGNKVLDDARLGA